MINDIVYNDCNRVCARCGGDAHAGDNGGRKGILAAATLSYLTYLCNIEAFILQMVTTIQEAKDLNVITLDEICGSLFTHELELKEEEEEDRKEAKEKKKSIAIKASILEEELDELSCDDDEEVALVARRFRKLMGKRNKRLAKRRFRKDQGSSWRTRNKNDSNKKEELTCFECKKPGHFKFECPLLRKKTPKRNKKSNKAMVAATWSVSDTSSSEVEEEKAEERANLCLMARDDESEVELHSKDTCSRVQLKKKQP
ncbi:zinc finger protein [Theobroma cacao]|nr:zinc finger protein [Theobroma cacao]